MKREITIRDSEDGSLFAEVSSDKHPQGKRITMSKRETKRMRSFRQELHAYVRTQFICETTEQRRARITEAHKDCDMSLDRLCAIELAYLSYFRGIDTPHSVTGAEYDMGNRYIYAM